ncbi:MAG TPA: hypothetical protein VMQ59_02260, partial [Acidimicrobiales bacterium]|nr:hypothetical protein [Acidimicrobiales bacterium]
AGEGRTYREAPEIDGIVTFPDVAPVGSFVVVVVVGADGPDLVGDIVNPTASDPRGRQPAAAGAAP